MSDAVSTSTPGRTTPDPSDIDSERTCRTPCADDRDPSRLTKDWLEATLQPKAENILLQEGLEDLQEIKLRVHCLFESGRVTEKKLVEIAARLDSTSCSKIINDLDTPTPTNTTAFKNEPEKTSAVPRPGKTFMLTDMTFKHALSLTNGSLEFVRLVSHGTTTERLQHTGTGCYFWHCVENNNGWLGFQNAASGTYLGHDKHGGCLQAWAKHHKGWEQFCVRHAEGGDGYYLILAYWDKLVKVSVEGEGEGMTCRFVEGGRGFPWGFVEL